jgi:Spermine/spermidine synthase domain
MSIGFQHPNVKVHIGDGFKFLEDYKNEFDVIITDSSDPEGPAESLFQKPYFELLNGALREGGVITTQGCSWSFRLLFSLLPYSPFQKEFLKKKANVLCFQLKTNGSTSSSSPTSKSHARKSSRSPNTLTPPSPPTHLARSGSWSAARMPHATSRSLFASGLARKRSACADTTMLTSTRRALFCPTSLARLWSRLSVLLRTRF